MQDITHKSILEMGRYRDLAIDGEDPEVLRGMYTFMTRLRRCQGAIMENYHPADEMRCPVHFCVGQEAVPAALSTLVGENDYILSHHRSHGYFFAKGGTMNDLLAELHGRVTGANGGIAGSQEISLGSRNFYSGAIISGMLSMAVGVGLGFKLKGMKGAAIGILGDAATEEGAFWEAVSYARLCDLPVLFICENNGYSTYSAQAKRQPSDNIHGRVESFGVETRAIFGNDVANNRRVIKEALDHVRGGKGPFFIEAYTYRWAGHVGPEDDDHIGYRSQSDIDAWKENCPILLLEEKMMEAGLLSEKGKEDLINGIDEEIKEAFEFARNSSFPEEPDWDELNLCSATPLADKFLKEEGDRELFDHGQKDAVPGPY